MKNELDFVINKDKRTITCIATECEFDVLKDLSKLLASYPANVKSLIYKDIVDTDELIIKDKFVGTAKCSPFDAWNEDYGKKLAIKKMRYKYNKAKFNVMSKYLTKLNDASDLVSMLTTWYSENVCNSEQYIYNCIAE